MKRSLLFIICAFVVLGCGGSTQQADSPELDTNTSTSYTGSTLAGNPIDIDFTEVKALFTVAPSDHSLSNIRVIGADHRVRDPFTPASTYTITKAGAAFDAGTATSATSGSSSTDAMHLLADLHVREYIAGDNGLLVIALDRQTPATINNIQCSLIAVHTRTTTEVSCINPNTQFTSVPDDAYVEYNTLKRDADGNIYFLEQLMSPDTSIATGRLTDVINRWNPDTQEITQIAYGDVHLHQYAIANYFPIHAERIYIAARDFVSWSYSSEPIYTDLLLATADTGYSTIALNHDPVNTVQLYDIKELANGDVIVSSSDGILNYTPEITTILDLTGTTLHMTHDPRGRLMGLRSSISANVLQSSIIEISSSQYDTVATPGIDFTYRFISTEDQLIYFGNSVDHNGSAIMVRSHADATTANPLITPDDMTVGDFGLQGSQLIATGVNPQGQPVIGITDITDASALEIIPQTETPRDIILLK